MNYDHDRDGRLLEDYWFDEWPTVVEDFREIKQLGANVVRVHLQVARFLQDATTPNDAALAQFERLMKLAEDTGLYLDVTGLGCYHKADVPAWYDALDEAARWRAQACFWEAIAQRGRRSPVIFCYDLMNEPVVAGAKREPTDWLGPAFAGKHFVQFITTDPTGRSRPDVAKAWTQTLVQAIRKHDDRHLVTVGLVDWSLDRPGLTSGFVPDAIAPHIDFLCVHLYPNADKLDEATATLKGFHGSKPVVIEETFPLHCSATELREFMQRSVPHAAGWFSFYWGQTPEELATENSIQAALLRAWLVKFQEGPPKKEAAAPKETTAKPEPAPKPEASKKPPAAPSAEAPAKNSSLPQEHDEREIEGWRVRVDRRLLRAPNEQLGVESIRLLAQMLHEIARLAPEDRLRDLRKVTIWLDLDHGDLRPMQYHPSAGWLKDHGYSTDLARCVHIPRAEEFSSPRHHRQQPWAVLHELAHAYHDQVLGFEEARVMSAWERCRDSKRYESVLHIDGNKRRHYLLTNQKEFFAEMSEAYFGMNDFFPFNRAELKQEEPALFELLQEIWGKLP